MVDVLGAGLVLVGVVILLGGAPLSIYGVGILGAVIGGVAGFLLAPIVGLVGPIGLALAVGVGLAAGLLVTYLVVSVAISSLGFLVGGYVGVVLTGVVLGADLGLLRFVVFVVGGVVGAGLAPHLTRTLLVVVTSFIGAALVSGSLSADDLATAQSKLTIDPLLFEPGPILLALFALGVLVQFGLFRFGHVRRLVAVLPGATVLRDRMGGSNAERKRA